jgi:PD-(D/E)XK nuclease superfamily protein
MSLDPSTSAMVGVGGSDCCINSLPPGREVIEAAAAAYRTKVAAMRRDSAEERYVIRRIRAALANGLELGGELLFLHQEWRFSSHEKLDVLAVDEGSGQLVVIEAKSSATVALRERDADGRTAAEQAASYAAQLVTHGAEYMPFFQRLALALGRIYRPGKAAVPFDSAGPPRCELWWPETAVIPVSQVIAPTLAQAESVADVSFVASDAPWQGELRRRQSRWRESRGFAIGLHRGRPLGSRLAMPDAQKQLWNFLSPAIGELVRQEYADNALTTRPQSKLYGYPRLFADLLSSQPLVFNLFGELALDLARASAAARRLWPGRVDRVTRIEFEWSPGRWNPRYLNNGTAADVALFHTTPSGGTGIIFVETKYHENLRGKDHKMKPRYLEVARESGAFQVEALQRLQTGSLQQIWFDHLLVLAMQVTDSLDSALFVLVYPEINERCREAALLYRATLDASRPTTFEARTLEELVFSVEDESSAEWARAFRERYLTPTG